MQRESYQLTKYSIGSIQEAWSVSWPLMMGLLSGSLMMFFDRLFLGNYSLEAMTSAASAGMAGYAFLMFPLITAGISEVFVGQHHGKGELHKMQSAVWQMVWFSVFCIPFFILAAKLAPQFIFGYSESHELKTSYFSIMMYGGVFFALSTALMGFFAGQGKTKLIGIATILANGVNIVLDYFLINDTGFPFSGMGITGAAIATVSAQFCQVLFFAYFLIRSSPDWMKKENWRLDTTKIVECLKIGAPAGFAHTNEMIVHFLFFTILELSGSNYLTIIVLIQSIYMVLTFVGEGMSKGVTAITSNLIGAKQYKYIFRNVISSAKIMILFSAVLAVIISLGYPDIFRIFFNENDLPLLNSAEFNKELYIAALATVLFFLLDGVVWVFIGLLTAAGDTTFMMIVNFVTYWVTYLSAVYIGIKFFNLSASGAWGIVIFNSCVILAILAIRAWKKPWLEKKLI